MSRLTSLIAVLILAVSISYCEGNPIDPSANAHVAAETPIDFPSRWSVSVDPTIGLDSQRILMIIDSDGDGPLEPSESTITIRSSFTVIPITFDYSVDHMRTVSLTVPYVSRAESMRIDDLSLRDRVSGLGDISCTYEQQLVSQSFTGWKSSAAFDISVPTGKSAYEGQKMPLGTGHYEIGANYRTYRIADPFVISFGLGVSYAFPRHFENQRISPELGYTAQTGIGFALSDKTILSEQLTFLRSSNIFIPGVGTSDARIDQAYLTHSFMHNYSSHTLLKYAFSVGLNDASTDYSASALIQYSW